MMTTHQVHIILNNLAISCLHYLGCAQTASMQLLY